MDEQTNLQELKDQVRDFCEARDWDQYHDLKELSIGLITEAAELLELTRFQSKDQCEALLNTSNTNRTQVEDEVADIFFFLLRLSQRYQIDLSQALKTKMHKNGEKYPIEKARGSNKKYTDL
jgi:NTP pyrophosphatase (non-canonical NTP hydrolase)